MYFNNRDNKGKFTKKTTTYTTCVVCGKNSTVTVCSSCKNRNKNTPQKIAYVAFVLDESGSMQGLRNKVVEEFNKQLEKLIVESKKNNIKTFVSVYKFSTGYENVRNSEEASYVFPLNIGEYSPAGQTALFDGVLGAAKEMDKYQVGNGDVSYLVITLTDGQENNSRNYTANTFSTEIRKYEGTDRWTFTFQCPSSSVKQLEYLGVQRGNIQAWEATERGLEAASGSTQSAFSGYMTSRSLGQTRSTSFYQPNFAQVNQELLNRLDNSTGDYLRLNVTGKCRIDNFVFASTGSPYILGSGFYELNKSEKVQDYKEIILQDKSTNKLYRGLGDIRVLLGLPTSGTITVRPSSHVKYRIFVKSTSVNRNLLPNTTLLLDKKLI